MLIGTPNKEPTPRGRGGGPYDQQREREDATKRAKRHRDRYRDTTKQIRLGGHSLAPPPPPRPHFPPHSPLLSLFPPCTLSHSQTDTWTHEQEIYLGVSPAEVGTCGWITQIDFVSVCRDMYMRSWYMYIYIYVYTYIYIYIYVCMYG